MDALAFAQPLLSKQERENICIFIAAVMISLSVCLSGAALHLTIINTQLFFYQLPADLGTA